MKVLHISSDGLGNGGVQNVIMSICRNMKNIQFDIILFTNEARYYDNEFESLGGHIFRIPKYEGANRFRKRLDYYIRFLRIFLGVSKVIKKHGPYDVIHCHNNFESGICCLAAYFAGIKVRITHAHTAEINHSRKRNIIRYLYNSVLRFIMNICSNVRISCSELAFTELFGEKYLSRDRSNIIPNAINISNFSRGKSDNNHAEKSIVHIGRFCDNKNQTFLLDMIPYIKQDIPNIMLKLVGFKEEYKNMLIEKSKQLSIESNIQFLPSESDKRDILGNADLFVFPSKKEGFGIVLLEAQSMGVPCLVSSTVPRDADCGLCRYLDLNEGAEVWAREAVKILNKEYELRLDKDKLNEFDISNYIKKIDCIYKGVSI